MEFKDNYKSCRGSTLDTSAHLKLSDSTEFKLKTWNANPKDQRWISTGMGGARKTLDSGITDRQERIDKRDRKETSQDSLKNRDDIEVSVGTCTNLAAKYAPRVKELNKLAAKERRGDTKRLLSNDRTLLLHNERLRYDELESNYQNLLRQVEDLQNAHSLELSTTRKKLDKNARALGHALDLKSQECVELNRSIQEWQARYADESSKWIFANEQLKEQLKPCQNKVRDLKELLAQKNDAFEIMTQKMKKEAQKYELKENELNRFIASFRRTESSFNKEREAWMEIKLELSEKIRIIDDLKKENESLKMVNSKTSEAVSDMQSLKPVLDEAKKKINHLVERERGLLSDLEAASTSHKLSLENEAHLKEKISQQEREYLILKGNHAVAIKEIEALSRSNQELIDLNTRVNVEKESENTKINQLLTQLDQFRSQNIKLEEQTRGLKRLNAELERQISGLHKEMDSSKSSSDDLYSRIDLLMQEKSKLSATLSLVQQDLHDLSNRYHEQTQLLDYEQKTRQDLVKQDDLKYQNLTERIEKLQSYIQETSKLLSDYKSNEISLRGALSERSDLLKEKEIEILQLKNTISSLKDSISSQTQEFQSVTEMRKSEVSQLSQVYESEVSAYKKRISDLFSQLNTRSSQVSQLTHNMTELKYENAQLVSDLTNMNSQLSNVKSSEVNLKNRLSSSESIIKTLESQIKVLKSKIESLESQIEVLKQETVISNLPISFEPLSLSKLQEKLSNQLDSLVESQWSL